MKKNYFFLMLTLTCATIANAQVVISQIYGGGATGTSTYKSDFVELFNKSQSTVNLSGWSVQFTSATSTAWSVTALPNFSLQPGQYFLIKGNTQSGGPGLDITTQDHFDNAMILNESSGKVLVVNTITAQTGANPTGSQIIDKVGYGATANGFEGSGPTGTDTSKTTSVKRNGDGCTDTNNNLVDFALPAIPSLRNSSIIIAACTLSINKNEILGLKIYPNPAKNILNITSDNFDVKNIEIYNVLGKVVLTSKVTNTPLNVSALTSGIYMLKVTENNKTVTRKLIID